MLLAGLVVPSVLRRDQSIARSQRSLDEALPEGLIHARGDVDSGLRDVWHRIAEAVKKFIAGVEGAKPDVRGGKAVDSAAYEREVEQQTAALEREAHRGLLQALDIDTERVVINGELHTRVGRYEAPYKTKAGAVMVMRSLYRKNGVRNGKTIDAVTLRIGAVEEGWLPATAQAMAFLVQQNPLREAKKAADQIGRLPYSRSSFERVTHAVGALYEVSHAQVEDALIEEFTVPAAAHAISVGLDRVSVPMEEFTEALSGKVSMECNYRMAFVGTVTAMKRSEPWCLPNSMNPGPIRSMASAAHTSISTMRHRPARAAGMRLRARSGATTSTSSERRSAVATKSQEEPSQ